MRSLGALMLVERAPAAPQRYAHVDVAPVAPPPREETSTPWPWWAWALVGAGVGTAAGLARQRRWL